VPNRYLEADMSTVLFPGSFDPVHLGHLDVIEQSVAMFGEVVVATMHNPAKPSGTFALDERQAMLRESTAHLPSVRVEAHTGLVIDAARAAAADFIVKGLRTSGDFEFELQMAHTNESVSGIRTVFVPTAARFAFVSSRFIREIAHYGGEVGHLVPGPVARRLALLATPERPA
jgi:pantetheine-phosphate adenylyltransferase